MKPHRQLVARALAPQGQEPTENGRPPRPLTFFLWGSKAQAQSGQGHGGAEARHLGLHHGLCGPQTPSPVLAPEEGEFRVPHRLAGLWEGTGSAGPGYSHLPRMEEPGPGKCGLGSLLAGPGLGLRPQGGWVGWGLYPSPVPEANRISPGPQGPVCWRKAVHVPCPPPPHTLSRGTGSESALLRQSRAAASLFCPRPPAAPPPVPCSGHWP